MWEQTYVIPALPRVTKIETVPDLRAPAHAGRALTDLNGQAKTIPKQGVLIDTLALQDEKSNAA